jgi:hypothetical protein
MTFPTIIVTGIGVYGFGMGIEAGQGPIVAAVFFGFAIASVVLTINTGFAYVPSLSRLAEHKQDFTNCRLSDADQICRCLTPTAPSQWRFLSPQ